MDSVWPDNGMNEELAATASYILGFDFSGRVEPLLLLLPLLPGLWYYDQD